MCQVLCAALLTGLWKGLKEMWERSVVGIVYLSNYNER